MKPIEFPEQNILIAEYLTLPAHVDSGGMVTSKWKLTFRERLVALFVGYVYIQQMTFGHPLQPLSPTVDMPDLAA